MNTDRELLELAAKAAGFRVCSWTEDDEENFICINVNEVARTPSQPWNPLTDDGDAFRLAAKLKINLEFVEDKVVFADGNWSEFLEDDPAAAVRRVIVRAAAFIGETME